MATLPPLPPGFMLEGDAPPLPPGFVPADQGSAPPTGAGLTREQRLERIAALEAELAGVRDEQNDSALGAVVGGTLSDLRGLPETALELGSGAISSAAGGISSIPVMAVDAIRNTDIMGNTGSGDAIGAGRAVVESFQDKGTFQPRTDVGKRASGAIAAPLEAFEHGADFAGQKVLETTGSEELAALTKTAILAAPMAFGIRKGATVRTAPAKATPRQALARQGAQEGYVTPPSQGGTASTTASLAEGLGGKIKVKQEAISRNQQVTNKLAARAVGLPEGVPITADVLSGIRSQAGQAYEAVRSAGRIYTDTAFRRDLSAATARFRSAAKDFPDLAKSEVIKVVEGLRKAEFEAGSGVDAISLLRNKADVAFRGGDKALGGSYKSAANAIEGAIERHLVRGGDPALLDSFRSARQQIAETYSVQDALQGRITGEVSATQLGSQLKRGKPLSGDLKTIAEFSNTFPSATRLFQGEALAFSPLDLAVGGSSAALGATALSMGAGPAGLIPLVGTFSRPLLRKAALSERLQGVSPKGSVRPSSGATSGTTASGLSQIGQSSESFRNRSE